MHERDQAHSMKDRAWLSC